MKQTQVSSKTSKFIFIAAFSSTRERKGCKYRYTRLHHSYRVVHLDYLVGRTIAKRRDKRDRAPRQIFVTKGEEIK